MVNKKKSKLICIYVKRGEENLTATSDSNNLPNTYKHRVHNFVCHHRTWINNWIIINIYNQHLLHCTCWKNLNRIANKESKRNQRRARSENHFKKNFHRQKDPQTRQKQIIFIYKRKLRNKNNTHNFTCNWNTRTQTATLKKWRLQCYVNNWEPHTHKS